MFKRGEKIHLHDGAVVQVKRTGRIPKRAEPNEGAMIRGFVRGALTDCLTGEVQMGEWHENTITETGHMCAVRNYIGLVSSATSALATNISQLALGRYFAVGYVTDTAAVSKLSTQANIQSEYGLQSNSTYNAAGASRAALTLGQQVLSGTWSLIQSLQYASTQIADGASINAIGLHSHSQVGSGSVLSVATFASSAKATTQALSISYNFVFSNT